MLGKKLALDRSRPSLLGKELAPEDDHYVISETFQPHVNDGYALIEKVETKAGKKLLDSMKILLPEGSVTAILGPSGAGKSTLLNTLTDSLSVNSRAVADSKFPRASREGIVYS